MHEKAVRDKLRDAHGVNSLDVRRRLTTRRSATSTANRRWNAWLGKRIGTNDKYKLKVDEYRKEKK